MIAINDTDGFDQIIEKLKSMISEDLQHYYVLIGDENQTILYNCSTRHLLEIYSFKKLMLSEYIPAAVRIIEETSKEVRKSKHKNTIPETLELIKENYYDTIRLGYIGIYHKYDNYKDDLLKHIDNIGFSKNPSKESFISYIERVFNYKLITPNPSVMYRLSWICSVNKHYDGKPLKTGKPIEYVNFFENERMRLDVNDFTNDINLLIQVYLITTINIFHMLMYRIVDEGEPFDQADAHTKNIMKLVIKRKILPTI